MLPTLANQISVVVVSIDTTRTQILHIYFAHNFQTILVGTLVWYAPTGKKSIGTAPVSLAATEHLPSQQLSSNMPKPSKRKRIISGLSRYLKRRFLLRYQRELDSDDDSLENAVDIGVARAAASISSSRYLQRQKYRKSSRKEATFDEDLQTNWLTKEEFKQKYRMDRENFYKVVEKIEKHPIFNDNNRKGRKQMSVQQQLMVFLEYVGTEGDGASNNGQRNTFCVGYGSAANYRARVTEAIRSLREDFLTWPDEDERKEIAAAFQAIKPFPRCVGVADGTLFPLAFSPWSFDAPDYSGRKFKYSLSVLIINDHKRRIRHYLAGFPGSAHDNKVWSNTLLCRNPQQYFSQGQYLLGDSAFSNGPVMVASYKKPSGSTIPQSQEMFNTLAASIRISSEHTIGMLKARFPWLRSIRMVITDDKKSLKRILELLEATIILHNILVDLNDETDEEWENEDDYVPHPDNVFDPLHGVADPPEGEHRMRDWLMDALQFSEIIQ